MWIPYAKLPEVGPCSKVHNRWQEKVALALEERSEAQQFPGCDWKEMEGIEMGVLILRRLRHLWCVVRCALWHTV